MRSTYDSQQSARCFKTASSLPAAASTSRHPLFFFFSKVIFFSKKKIRFSSEQSGRWFRFKASYEAHRRCWKRTEDAIVQVLQLACFAVLVHKFLLY